MESISHDYEHEINAFSLDAIINFVLIKILLLYTLKYLR